ncbi:MAG: DUF5117 domain-containing protein [Candidatus Marinimicrobia bacterium]|nr:DUF5117 domain-containing protein [Candidatus Neomarinimicrobiota bacterium]
MRTLSYMIIILIFAGPFPVKDITANEVQSIREKTETMDRFQGFFDFFRDSSAGKIYLKIDSWETEFLYMVSLPAGLGSNDVGLDRGQLGSRHVVEFRRVGPKVLLVEPNIWYRARSDNQAERRAVTDAFAESVLWGFDVIAEEGESVLVDATDFYLRDAHDVVGRLKATNQGNYQLEKSRSALYPENTKNFPDNTEVEVTLTFTGDSPGQYVRQVTPTPEAITLRQRHSLIRLPDDDYVPREFDPRAGFFPISYWDYAAPIEEPITRRFITRHRLQKKNPSAARSEPVEPIVYYVDPGTPEPIRSALIEGASWWNEAFEAAGFIDAFQVKILPEGADPMDVRYNTIQWVHRSTRGWSYGDAVTDPRTGEILKGHVTLGSLRVRQDYLIAEGLLAPYEKDVPAPDSMEKMALARLHQLSAHEVGHTIGLAHNFAASIAGRVSVMDYPHPLVKIDQDGQIDLSDAYDTGIGDWDKIAVQYGYTDFGTEPDLETLQNILTDYFTEGRIFISDRDARPEGGAHPLAHLWDNGNDPVTELQRVLKVRKLALDRFSERNIPVGEPYSNLEDVLVPIYMFHRYQVDAVSKLIGGLYYTYALRGDGQQVTRIVSAERQRDAVKALLETLDPEALALSEDLLKILPPKAYGYRRSDENFKTYTGLTFDPLAAAETAADFSVGFLLHPERAARLIEYHARDSRYPAFSEVLNDLIEATWFSDLLNGYIGEIQKTVNNVVLYHLMHLSASNDAPPEVRAVASAELADLKSNLQRRLSQAGDTEEDVHFKYAISRITLFQENPGSIPVEEPLSPPAGPPIGMGCGISQH